MKRTTIKDIAKRLNVNPSTVSRALKDHPDIGISLRLEIKRLAKEMHYRPNQMAVQLRLRSSRLVGMIVPEVTMFFYPSVIKGIQEELHNRGYNLIMLVSNESAERELENLQICAENEVAGILISVSRNTLIKDNISLLEEIDIPIVLFDKIQEGLPFDCVLLEDEESAAFAVRHLINTGCTRIGGLFGNPNLLITQRRVQGLRKALAEFGLPFLEHYIYFADNPEEAENCAEALMALDLPPDGVFMMTDEITIGALPIIVQSGLKIPAECSVICISDGVLPQRLYPKVTYLHHDGVELGKLAAIRLLTLIDSGELIKDDYLGEKIMVQTKLVELSTTRPLKK